MDERKRDIFLREGYNDAMQPIVDQKIGFRSRTWLYLETGLKFLQGKYKPSYRDGQLNSQEVRKAVNQYGEFLYEPGREVERDWLSRELFLKNRSYQITIEALREIIHLCHERGIMLIFLRLPPAEEILSKKIPLYKVMLEEELRDSDNIIYLDVWDVYRKYLNKQELTNLPSGFYSSPGDASHPGPFACTLIAKALESVIFQAMQKQPELVRINRD